MQPSSALLFSLPAGRGWRGRRPASKTGTKDPVGATGPPELLAEQVRG